ncbi:hypothetical protein GlitD10_1556 [Gloeomargarita lithophora Alchichica-D10]|uniref:DUF2254 domain-containing protein n=1 Tax=Gloeomargarita lithophora Alchichica-D10 TaxID=1188229 RepID=A0A1J0AD95_9CYAN|nr:DUF2254 family protein [Gloeomargarita lithophora]APB33879.1 hypothetical protein GlitD10_1556 [Gloeomargarita lithophora Alchichica-D10]
MKWSVLSQRVAVAVGLVIIALWVVGPGARWVTPRIQDVDALAGFVSTLAEVLAGVLGFTISAVAIVVQLSAERFSPKVTELFLRERTNLLTILFLIIANLISVWTTLAFAFDPIPFGLVVINLLLGSMAFIILIPYFIFVLDFLQPSSIIQSLERQVQQGIQQRFNPAESLTQITEAHRSCISALGEFRSIAISAIQQRDQAIILGCLESLRDLAIFYGDYKSQLPAIWFRLTPPVYKDSEFISVDAMKLREIEAQKIWLEVKIFRQYQGILTNSLLVSAETCTLVGICTREIGEQALDLGHGHIIHLTVKFFNTYLRLVVNQRDIRAGYNIIKQYRLLAEQSLLQGFDATALEIGQHFRYYSIIAYKASLFFLCETFAYDLGHLVQTCSNLGDEVHRSLLDIFLKIDQDPESEQQEQSSRGVRKSQVKLAAYYLSRGDKYLADLIFHDMHHEPYTRVQIICEELLSTGEDFWEFTDRGESFYYLEPELRPYVQEFFSWFYPPSVPAPG